DPARIWTHLRDLMVMMDPWGAYRRHFELGPHLFGQPYVAYRWAWMAACVVVLLALGVTGLGTRRPAYLVVAIFPALLLTAVGATPQTYEIHHVTVVKPMLYVAASVLGGRLAGWRPAPVVVAWTVLATAALLVQVRAFADLCAAGPTRGIYGVTWNMSDAWQ